MKLYLLYVLKRLLQAVPMLLAVTIVTFLLVRALPGDPASTFAGDLATPEQIETVRKDMGWDLPLVQQYIRYMGDLLQGNLGRSLFGADLVLDDIKRRLPATFEIVLYGLILAVLIGVPLGMTTAAKILGPFNKPANQLTFIHGLLAGALPDYWWALLTVYVFFYKLRLVPAPMGRISIAVGAPQTITGMYSVDSLLTANWPALWSSLAHLALPVAVMAFFTLGPIMKITRESVNEALNSNYVRYARMSGLSNLSVATYALRNALVSVITIVAFMLGYLLGAAVLMETVFSWGGLGQYAVASIKTLDYFAVQGVILVLATFSLVLYLVVDLLYAAVDPRVRL